MGFVQIESQADASYSFRSPGYKI